MRPLVVGHRGAAAYALENTALSFQKAIEFGVDWIEFDVHESLDGEFIVIHDSHLGRISSRKDWVRKTNSQLLKAIDLYQNQRLITLGEAFEIIPSRIGLMVEVKSLRSFAKMAQFIKGRAALRNVTLTSFDLTLLSKIQIYSRDFSLGVVSKSPANIFKAQKMGIRFSDVCLDFMCLTAPLISQLQQQNLRIFAWTVDRPRDIERILNLKVDGIISNKPDLVQKIVAAKQTSPR